MKNKIQWQSLLPHLGIIIGFLILSLIYTSPLLENKKLRQNDVLQAKGAAQELEKYREETGKRALWTNSMFSGMPAFMVNMDYPYSFPTQIGRFLVNIVPFPANMIFLYLLGAYLMFWMLGYSVWVRILGAIGFTFASYSIINIEAGHNSKVIALAFTPPFVASVILAYRSKPLLYSALAGLFAGLQLYANHPQITYYVFLALVLFVIYELIRLLIHKETFKNFISASIFLAIAGGLAVGSHASRLWTTYEYTQQTIRGPSELKANKESKGGADRDYAFQWSYGVGESFTFLIPNFVGGGQATGLMMNQDSRTYKALQANGLDPQYTVQMPFYWGDQPFTSGPAYWGAIVILLALFGLLVSRDSIKWWLLAVIVFFVMLSWGKNLAAFNNIVFDTLPLYNKFRAHTMVLSLVQIFVVWLGVLGVKELLSQDFDFKKHLKSLYISAGVVGGLALFFALLGDNMQNFQSSKVTEVRNEKGEIVKKTEDQLLEENLVKAVGPDAAKNVITAIRGDRKDLQYYDAWRSFVFILLASALLWLALSKTVPSTYVIGGVAFLALLDLWVIDRRYLNNENFVKKSEYEDTFEIEEAERKILADQGHYRVYKVTPNVYQDAITSYYFKSIGGYHAAKLRRYQDLIEKHLGQNNQAIINMLNTKYFIMANEKGETIVQQNREALGNAWFVENYKIVKDADEEINAFNRVAEPPITDTLAVKKELTKNIDPKKTAVIDQRFKNELNNLKINFDSTAKITLTEYKPDQLTYESDCKSPQLAVFSEIYYNTPGKIYWQAYIDGKEVPHFRANYVLRAMVVPAGKHKIEFKFKVPIYEQGEWISLLCSLLLFSGIGVAIWLTIRESAKN
jgi:hypothetical protein